MHEWMPLFPLQVVLLPGNELPLHIFEDRYKEMIADVIRERIEFGVVLAAEKGIANIGCTATIDKVLREYPDGRMDILTIGRRRFELERLNEDRSYLRGAVEFFDDEELAGAPESVEQSRNRAIESYNALRALESDPPLSPAETQERQLSFKLARPVTDLALRQSLLVARSETERIRLLASFLPEYVVKQQRVQHIKTVAPRNGHGRHLPDLN
jgi:Lon protease-like protein